MDEDPARSLAGRVLHVRNRSILETRNPSLQRLAAAGKGGTLTTSQLLTGLMDTQTPTVAARGRLQDMPARDGYSISFADDRSCVVRPVSSSGEVLELSYEWRPARYGEETGVLRLYDVAGEEVSNMIVCRVEFGTSVCRVNGRMVTSWEPAEWPTNNRSA
jgi:hypothetical protein